MRIHGKPLEQRLQSGPQPVTAQGRDRVELAEGWHVLKLLMVCLRHHKEAGLLRHPITG
jgi:hypothetical protein